jgi:opacity protein-like surface antigen
MTRRYTSILMFACAVAPIAAGAQTSAIGERASVTLASGASVSHETSGFVGAQGDLHLTRHVALFVEGGKIWDASTSDLAAGAARIASVMGTTSSVDDHIAYADAGVRLSIPLDVGAEPYIAGGFGAARVRTATTFAGSATTSALGAWTTQIGTDLNGSVTKPMVMAGAGAAIPFSRRVFADLSVRYSRVLAKTSQIANDQAIDLVRLQAGLGVRF